MAEGGKEVEEVEVEVEEVVKVASAACMRVCGGCGRTVRNRVSKKKTSPNTSTSMIQMRSALTLMGQ